MFVQFFVIVTCSARYLRHVMSQQSSPCPSMFSYENRKQDSWIGVISYTSTTPIKFIEIWIDLDKEAKSLTSNYGAVTTHDNIKFLITEPSFVVETLNVRIKFKVTYEGTAPQISAIKINHKRVCPEVMMSTPRIQQELENTEPPKDISTESNNYLQKREPTGEHCGTVVIPQPLILNSQPTIDGHYPWHAALYEFESNPGNLTYLCGGSLITVKHILTAGHCTVSKKPENLNIFLGKHHLSLFNEYVQARTVSKLFLHPEYNNTHFFNDIAILELKAPVKITPYVRTVCLWRGDTDKFLFRETGVIVGWGTNINKQNNEILQEAYVPNIETDECRNSDKDFYSRVLYPKNFCAGHRNGTTACLGDSGGGLIIKHMNKNNNTYWYLRGLVSISKRGNYVCDDNSYTLCTHVDKFIDWIEKTIGHVIDDNVTL